MAWLRPGDRAGLVLGEAYLDVLGHRERATRETIELLAHTVQRATELVEELRHLRSLLTATVDLALAEPVAALARRQRCKQPAGFVLDPVQ